LKYYYTAPVKEKVILIGLITHIQREEQAKEYLDELSFLVVTAGGIVTGSFVQRLEFPDAKTYVGSGKLSEIGAYVKTNHTDAAVFDDELSPSQIRNIEKVLECKILDRTNLILHIFARRAQTTNAKTQVELAQLQYLLPRLTRMWTHLTKQKGGMGMRGPGEKEIETDRRIIRTKIALLKEKLKLIDKQKKTQRSGRVNMVRVALVGYTNVGKSTIMNLLSKSEVFAENKLFATLDTTVRKMVIGSTPFLLTDTVGFIRKLPHHLVDSFKSTLDEIRDADILMHIVDISHSNFEEHISVVKETLTALKITDKPVIIVFNKTDACQIKTEDEYDVMNAGKYHDIETLKKTWMAKINAPCVFISALKKDNIEELKKILLYKVNAVISQKYAYREKA